jgi:hypothetical protein
MCDGAKVFRKICALYAESRKLIRYDGRVNFVTFLTYLHAGLYLLPISHIITYYDVLLLLLLCTIPTTNTIPESPHDVRFSQ